MTQTVYVPVKASERMPEKGGKYFVTCFHKDYPELIYKGDCQIQRNGEYFFPNQAFVLLEWLEQTESILLTPEEAEKIKFVLDILTQPVFKKDYPEYSKLADQALKILSK